MEKSVRHLLSIFTILLCAFCLNGCKTTVLTTDGPHYEHYTIINDMTEPLKITGISHDNKRFSVDLAAKESYSVDIDTLEGEIEQGKQNIVFVKSIRFDSETNGYREFRSEDEVIVYMGLWTEGKNDHYSLKIDQTFFD